ncbi:MAG TPA: hypothetical protein VGJ14_16475 [Sporichthyaceae bacterium]
MAEPASGTLPELAAVPWRPLADDATLRRTERLWTLTTLSHVVPFCAVAVGLFLLAPITLPIGVLALGHAWVICEVYAARGANVVRPALRSPLSEASERTALGLLGDLVGHDARHGFERTGLVCEPGRLGVWLVGEKGALLVRPGGRRVHCLCVRVPEPNLPRADRVAHLLLALRADERGFATLANCSFAGARWRVRRRLPATMRPGLDAAGRLARRPNAPWWTRHRRPGGGARDRAGMRQRPGTSG